VLDRTKAHKKKKMKRSNNIDFMMQAIASDFKVEQVAQDKNWILFAAERKDFFHFVEWDTTDTMEGEVVFLDERPSLTQHHLPHLAIARAIERTKSKYEVPIQGRISIMPQNAGEMFLVIRGRAVLVSSLAGGLGDRLEKVSSILVAARKKVVFEDGRYGIPSATTHGGNPLSSVSKNLIEGIAFEKALRRRLNARDFGLYSAFCTHMDLPCPLNKNSCLKEFLAAHFDCYGGDFPDNGFFEVAREVQNRLFPYPIWGPSIAADSRRAIDALQTAVAKLDPVQATQVVLLNGMHGADIFLALAAVTGIITFEQYRDFQTDDFAPDSEDEQFIRISASFIELFGDVAPPCPGHAGMPRKKRKSSTPFKKS
jgi:hypothetical protein